MPKERRFGELARDRGLIDDRALEEALAAQAALTASGQHQHLGEMLIGRGVLTALEVQQVLEWQGKRMLFCPECFVHVNVKGFEPDHAYRCRKCGEALISSGEVSSSGGMATRVEELEVEQPLARTPLAGRAVLRIASGSLAGAEVRLAEGETLHLGNREDADLVLRDPGVMPLHCKIRSNGVDVMLFDYQARGATRVNGQPVDYVQLYEEDALLIGSVAMTVVGWPSAGEGAPAHQALIGRALVERGVVSEQQVMKALQEQDARRRAGTSLRLGEILVAQGLVSPQQVDSALELRKNRRLHVKCPSCGTSFNLRGGDLGQTFGCSSCGKALRIPKNPLLMTATVGIDRTSKLPRPTVPTPRPRELSEPVAGEVPPRQVAAAVVPDGPRSPSEPVLAVTQAELDDDGPPLGLVVPPDEAPYARYAHRGRYATRDQIARALELLKQRRALGPGAAATTLGQLLVEQRAMTPAHHQQILANLGLVVASTSIPGYQLVAKLGEGASGTVYHALKLAGRRAVALKIIRSELYHDERFVRRFYREAEISMRLDHPNIVSGVDAGQHRTHLYMVMELFDGETVEAYLRREGRASERYTMEIGYQMALALAHAGSHNLIHRDVKPGNIVLDRGGHAKLIDLGLAKQVTGGANVTQPGLILGTPNYISPEQARGDRVVDHRSDIYSLGASLYHMVVGHPPFVGASPIETMMMHMNAPVVPPIQLSREVSHVFSQVLVRMMDKRPEQRFQTWDEVAGKLETLLLK